ncbi:MAG: hypothetical protein ACO3PN_10810 [Chthoniobacterales bacterium]
MLGLIAGADPDDPTASLEPVPDYLAGGDAGLRGVTLGWDESFACDDVDPGVRRSVLDALEVLRGLGAGLQGAGELLASGLIHLPLLPGLLGEGAELLRGAGGVVFLALDADPSLARGDLHAEALFHLPEQTLVVLVKRGGRAGGVEMERGALHQAAISAETRKPAPSRCGLRVRTGSRQWHSKCRSSAV